MARMHSAQGKWDDAAKEMKLAMAATPKDQKSHLDGLVRQLDINQQLGGKSASVNIGV
jgi:hypothetical protein